MRGIQCIYFVLAIVIPFIFLVALGVIWMVPLRLRVQKIAFQVVEILNAWATVDVLVVTILVCILEIPGFAEYMVGGYCGELNEWLAVLD